ncbi:fibrinolytic enzyme isozyme C [Biomphalaria glabrata]
MPNCSTILTKSRCKLTASIHGTTLAELSWSPLIRSSLLPTAWTRSRPEISV